MSELRYDPIKQRWAIIASERKLRPQEFVVPHPRIEDKDAAAGCPFEAGSEHLTPPEILVLPPPPASNGGRRWQVRVVPNKFPALRVEGEVVREGVGPFDRVSGVGAHEVIIESPDHHREMADLTSAELAVVFAAYRERLVDLRRDHRLRYILIFKNAGREAGASLYHPHSQLIATPIIPTFVVQELNAAQRHYSRKERCIFCDLIHEEQLLGDRIGLETEDYVAIQPFASAFPFETWILPKKHHYDLAQANDDELHGLAVMVRDLLRRLRVLLDDPPYNMVVHTAPSPHPRPGQPSFWSTIEYDFHWHLEIVPRITRIAGFEWGSGYTINPTPPEEASRFLKEADPDGGAHGETP
jgi:UDPglucose--hexose-1-phosphate uridylyltransferase